MKIVNLLNAVCRELKNQVSQMAECLIHDGPVDLIRLEQNIPSEPTFYLTLSSVRPAQVLPQGQYDLPLRFVGYLVVPKTSMPTCEQRMSLVELLLEQIPGANWREAGVSDASNVTVSNEYSPEIDQAGFVIWRFNWTHRIRVGESLWPDSPDMTFPDKVFLGRVPDIGFGHETDYQTVVEQK